MQAYTCCVLGHRKIEEGEALEQPVYKWAEKLVLEEGVHTFLFGSKSQFNHLCYTQVTKLKEKYPEIRRIYVRAEFPEISDDYERYLLERYEGTFYPSAAVGAGKAVYIKRNFAMIDKSRFCIVYYKRDHALLKRTSGTKLALEYALRQKREIILLPNEG